MGAAVQVEQQGGGYAVRHWSGKLGLAKSFWINGAGVYLLSTLYSFELGRHLRDSTRSHIRLGIISYLGVLAAVRVWQCVGIWRASHGARVHPFARLLARLGVVALMLDTGVDVVNASSGLGAAMDGTFTVRLLGKGEEVELHGVLNDGAADRLAALLDAHPKVRTLHLTSPGGFASEGLRLANLVRDRRLRIVVDTQCASACTLVLLASGQRLARPEAKVGFHRAYRPGRSDPIHLDEQIEALDAVGASKAFQGRVLSTPSYDMWHPSQARLLDEHIITAIARPDEFVYCPPYDTADEARRAFAHRGTLAAMLEVDPARFQRLIADFMAGPARGATQAESLARIAAEESSMVQDALCHPAQAVARAWAEQAARDVATLAARFPKRCAELLESRLDLNGLTAEEYRRYMDAARSLIVESARAPSPAPTPAEFEEARAALKLELSLSTRETLDAWKRHESRPQQALCSAAVDYHRTIAGLEPGTIARLIRYCPHA